MKSIIKNKKGQVGLILFFIVLFVILFVGVLVAFGSSLLNIVFDEVTPELTNLGTIGGWNATETADMTIKPLETIVNSFQWLSGVLYVMALLGLMGLAMAFRSNPNQWLIVFFFMLVLVLIIGSIIMSNIYEDFYDDTDLIGQQLREHTILSFMILYSPMIFTVIAFISGIILFSGRGEETYV